MKVKAETPEAISYSGFRFYVLCADPWQCVYILFIGECASDTLGDNVKYGSRSTRKKSNKEETTEEHALVL